MSFDVPVAPQTAPHVVVFGSEKGGSGKSTLAIHLAVGLLRLDQRVALIDLDSRQRILTQFVANRRSWANRVAAEIRMPTLYHVPRAGSADLAARETTELTRLHAAVLDLQSTHDFVVIDTPPDDTFLMRLAHAMADTLVTPLNDTFLDFCVLGMADPIVFEVTALGHYAELVGAARRLHRDVVHTDFRWLVARNRWSRPIGRHKAAFLRALAARLCFTSIHGLPERPAYEELFPRGLTVLDEAADVAGTVEATLLKVAQREVLAFVGALRLPLNESRPRYVAMRAEWLARRNAPIQDDVLAEALGDPLVDALAEVLLGRPY
jgi:chromosome partitioning protein